MEVALLVAYCWMTYLQYQVNQASKKLDLDILDKADLERLLAKLKARINMFKK
jgi:hypothetical protein